jgi:hypothetical protein
MLRVAAPHVGLEVALEGGRQRRHPVLVALAVAHQELIGREPDVLHAETRALEQAETSTVHEHRHEPRHAVEPIEDGANLVAREHHRQVGPAFRPDEILEPRQLLPEDLPVEEQERAERLVLGALTGSSCALLITWVAPTGFPISSFESNMSTPMICTAPPCGPPTMARPTPPQPNVKSTERRYTRT